MADSKYQIDIFDTFVITNFNILINAAPGSGKTYTLLKLMNLVGKYKKTVFLAFNKSIQEELSKKVPEGVDVYTLHGMGYRILRSNIRTQYKINENKTFILTKKHFPLHHIKKESEKTAYYFTVQKLLELYRLNLCETEEQLNEIATQYDVPLMYDEVKTAVRAMDLINTYNQSFPSEFMIDFVDMLYLPYKFVDKNKYPKYHVVMLDEAQDMSSIQLKLMQGLIKKGGRFVAAGDPNQMLYGFIGATEDSFKELKSIPNTIEKPLSVCYRCGKNIVKEINKVFNKVEAFEELPDGIVRNGNIKEVKGGDMVVCRNNLPLVGAYIDILSRDIPANILGNDLSGSLKTLLKKIHPKTYIKDISKMLEDKLEMLAAKGIKTPQKHPSYISLSEKIQILLLLNKKCGGFDQISQVLDKMATEKADNNHVILSTIHKAKGLESKRVFFLGRELIPSKYAKTPLALYQERCSMYVAVSRAEEELIYVSVPKELKNVTNLI